MHSSSELRFLMALNRVPGLGDHSIRKLIQRFGSAEAVFEEKKEILAKLPGIGEYKLRGFERSGNLSQADEELEFAEKNGIDITNYYDNNYPELLRHCQDAPLILFSKGNVDLVGKKVLSIVGTRNVTVAGSRICKDLVREISPLNPVIVSGFAYGIDICAHLSAVEENLQTIACLAHGMEQYYPKGHERYAERIMENGGFLTEFWSTDPFDRKNFIRRNRIIAGISEATVVVESAARGGSLVTADMADSYNREVFAVPGRISDPFSVGCNDLIKTQRAHLLSSAADIVYHTGWDLEERPLNRQQQIFFPELQGEEKLVFDQFEDGEKHHFDEMLVSLKWPPQKLASVLFDLELKGLVLSIPGKLYSRA